LWYDFILIMYLLQNFTLNYIILKLFIFRQLSKSHQFNCSIVQLLYVLWAENFTGNYDIRNIYNSVVDDAKETMEATSFISIRRQIKNKLRLFCSEPIP
jgi:hypothetical protein